MNIEQINHISGQILKCNQAISKIHKLAKKLVTDKNDLNIKLLVEAEAPPLTKNEDQQKIDFIEKYSEVLFPSSELWDQNRHIMCRTDSHYKFFDKIGFEQEHIPNSLGLIILDSMIRFYNDQLKKYKKELFDLCTQEMPAFLKSIPSNWFDVSE